MLCSYKYLSESSRESLRALLSCKWENPRWRYKDLENRRHVGLGQEASSGLSKNWRYVDLKKCGDTWVSETGGKHILTNNERTREHGP